MTVEQPLFTETPGETPEPWWQGRMCGLDLETTSAEPTEARMVSAAISLVGGGHETWSHTWLVNPEVPIPAEASAINGILDEDVADAPKTAEVMPSLLDVLEEVVEQRIPLVVFNAPYDCTVLDREARRCGMGDRVDAIWQALRVVDPMVVDRMIDTFRKGSRKLGDTCRIYEARAGRLAAAAGRPWPADRPGILERERNGPHAAAADAIACVRLAWLIATKGKVEQTWPENEVRALEAEWAASRHDLDRLHEWQRRWRHADQLQLRDRWREQGNPKWEGVRPEWPVYPEVQS